MNDSATLRCQRFGWTALALFLLMGLALESLHLFKLPFYLEVHLRRELWTLAHAHGTLLAILTIVFALSSERLIPEAARRSRAGWSLCAASLLVPAGFFLGGIGNSEPDPSLFIVLVPLGALLALHAVAVTAVGAWRLLPKGS